MPLDPQRTVAELKELRELTATRTAPSASPGRRRGSGHGRGCARRSRRRAQHEIDAAGNQWFTLPGDSERALLIGGHMDSVPNGGWLDGCLDVLAGVEVLRRVAAEGTPPLTVRLVDWADEEGARFGRSLFGSSRRLGLDGATRRRSAGERDANGVALPDALAEHGVDLDRALEARAQLDGAAAYLELHIEQGPVLESLELPLGVVLGTFGVERHLVTWRGQAAHAGSTPMAQRRDALAGAAKLALEIRPIAAEVGTVPSAPPAVSPAGRGSSLPSSRPPSSSSTSGISTRPSSRGCSSSRGRRASVSPAKSGSRWSGSGSGGSTRFRSTSA